MEMTHVLCIDLKSFYASVECSLRGLDPFSVNLVVADKERGGGSIVLAVTPHLKKYGVASRCRIYELPTNLDIIFAKPRMQKYIDYSCMIYDVYLKYVSAEDIHVYSIDEAFLDLSPYMRYYQQSIEEIAKKIITDIYLKTNITATCGIGANMFLAKVALDCLAKKSPSNIAYLDDTSFKEKLWDLRPISEIWGIGFRTAKHLEKMGIYCLRDLANYPPEKLKKTFGVVGLELYDHAHGIDKTTVQEARNYIPESRSFGHGQALYEDYSREDAKIILTEMVDELVTELIMRKKCCQLIGLAIGYSQKVGGGFGRQLSFDCQTNSRKMILDGFLSLYNKYTLQLPVRRLGVRLGKLTNEQYIQADLFEGMNKTQKEHDLYQAIGEIKNRFGRGAIFLAVSKSEKATLIKRNKLIGGHNAD
ncbi:MAG: damage repair protein [Bacilli bacterium]